MRLRVLGLLFITVVINYLDRSNLSVANSAIAHDLGADPVRMGWIFSAFAWTYALCQIPSGWLVDRLPPVTMYATICGLWSIATFLQGFAATVPALIALRLLLGIFEAPSYPLNNRLVTIWFDHRHRASATATYISGQFAGLAVLTPVLFKAEQIWGWHAVFFCTGSVGILWALVWATCCPRAPETAHAEARAARRPHALPPGAWKAVFTYRPLWGIYIGQFAVNSVLWFFLSWFPSYLVDYRHFTFLRAGFLASLPFLAAFCGVHLSGQVSDLLVRRGMRLNVARKIPVIGGLLLQMTIVGANFTDRHAWIIFFLVLASLGNGFASISWTFVSQFSSPELVGLSGGVFNACGNAASIAIPIMIGYIARDGSFAPALAAIAGIAVIGAGAYLFLVPNDSKSVKVG